MNSKKVFGIILLSTALLVIACSEKNSTEKVKPAQLIPVDINNISTKKGTSRCDYISVSCKDGTKVSTYMNGMTFRCFVAYDGWHIMRDAVWISNNELIINYDEIEEYAAKDVTNYLQVKTGEYSWKILLYGVPYLATYCDYEYHYTKISNSIISNYFTVLNKESGIAGNYIKEGNEAVSDAKLITFINDSFRIFGGL